MRSIQECATLSRLVEQGNAREIPGLNVSIAQVLKVEPTRLESLQEDKKLAELKDLILTDWPDSRIYQSICIHTGVSVMN